MSKQKVQNMLIIVLIIVVVLLASFLLIGLNKMTAQARNEIGGGPRDGVSLPAQNIFTDEFNFVKGDAAEQGGQQNSLEGFAELQSASLGATGIGGQSTNSGTELVPAAAFRHDGLNGSPSKYRIQTYLGGYIRNNDTVLLCVVAPVYLPDGATLTRFTMYFVDDHATYDMWRAYLIRHKLSAAPGTSSENVMDLDFLNGTGIDSSAPFFAWSTVINTSGAENVSNDYGYSITFCFDESTGLDQLLYGFNVNYNLP